MDVKIKRLLTGIAAVAAAAALLVSGAYAAPVTPDDSWIAAENWEDAKDDGPETAVVPATTPAPLPSDEQIIVSGRKTWNHRSNPVAKRPDSITVIIKADNAIVVQRRITAADHWSWSFRLPKYNRNGREITYTVDEARFEDYAKTVDGYNLINTYSPGSNTGDPDFGLPGGSPPKTDDTGNLALWLILMAASLGGLFVIIIFLRRRRGEKSHR